MTKAQLWFLVTGGFIRLQLNQVNIKLKIVNVAGLAVRTSRFNAYCIAGIISIAYHVAYLNYLMCYEWRKKSFKLIVWRDFP